MSSPSGAALSTPGLRLPLSCLLAIFDHLPCADVLRVRALCRKSRDIGGLHLLAAIAFAASRPCLPKFDVNKVARRLHKEVWIEGPGGRGVAVLWVHKDRTPCRLTMWMLTWASCAKAVEWKGKEASAWARLNIEGGDFVFNYTDMLDRCFREEGQHCMSVLAMRCPSKDKFFCLLLLSDGSFALGELRYASALRADGLGGVQVFMRTAGALEELAPFWDIDGDGRLVCSMEGAKQCVFPCRYRMCSGLPRARGSWREARDGKVYTLQEFIDWYGPRRGLRMWQEAPARGRTSEETLSRLLMASRLVPRICEGGVHGQSTAPDTIEDVEAEEPDVNISAPLLTTTHFVPHAPAHLFATLAGHGLMDEEAIPLFAALAGHGLMARPSSSVAAGPASVHSAFAEVETSVSAFTRAMCLRQQPGATAEEVARKEDVQTTEEIEHAEPGAQIPPEEAAAIAHQLWAGYAERLSGLCMRFRAPVATELGDVVFLVRLSRACEDQRRAVLGRELEPVRTAAVAEGHSWKHASGATVFLYPAQYPCVLEAIRGRQLRPHHVVITEAFLPMLCDEISKLRTRAKVRICSQQPLMLVPEDVDFMVNVERTFFNVPVGSRPGQESVVQSARGPRDGENPRRHMILQDEV